MAVSKNSIGPKKNPSTLTPEEGYGLDIDPVSVTWLPLHPIMAKAHIDKIDNSTILFGQEAVKQYRDKLKEIMMQGERSKRLEFSTQPK